MHRRIELCSKIGQGRADENVVFNGKAKLASMKAI